MTAKPARWRCTQCHHVITSPGRITTLRDGRRYHQGEVLAWDDYVGGWCGPIEPELAADDDRKLCDGCGEYEDQCTCAGELEERLTAAARIVRLARIACEFNWGEGMTELRDAIAEFDARYQDCP